MAYSEREAGCRVDGTRFRRADLDVEKWHARMDVAKDNARHGQVKWTDPIKRNDGYGGVRHG